MVPIYTYIIVCILYIHIKKYIRSFCKKNDDDDNNKFKKKSLQTSIKNVNVNVEDTIELCTLLIP